MASIQRIKRKSGLRFKVFWRDKTGHQWTETFKSEEMARHKAITVEADKIRGKRVDRGQRTQPYGHLAEDWFRGHVSTNLTEKVRGSYRNKLDRQLLPFWSHVRVGDIDADSVSRWVEWCGKKAFAEWTTLEAFTAMSASLGWAVKVRKLDENPLRGLRGLLPKPPRGKERTVLEPAEIVRLADATKDKMYRAMVLLLGCTGMRPGEMLALRVRDLHLKKEEVPYAWISRSAVVGANGRMVMNERTKTGEDRRVDLVEPAKSALIDYLTGKGFGDDDLVFPGQRSGGIFYESYLRVIVIKAGEACKFNRVVPYGLRHSYCVNAIRATTNIEYTARQMGHRTVQTTLSIYNKHVTSASHTASVKALEAAFQPVETTQAAEDPAATR